MRYFVDVARPNSRRRKKHIAYDGERILKVRSLAELSAAEEVYLDALFPQIFDDVKKLLESNVRVYVLTNTKIVKWIREGDNLDKSDENDAVILSKASLTEFKKLTLDQLLLEEDIEKYRRLTAIIKVLKRWKTDGDLDDDFNLVINRLRRRKRAAGKSMIERVESVPVYGELYREIREELGLRDSVILAILVVKLPLYLSVQKLKAYLGFTPKAKKAGNYNHELRDLLSKLALAISRKEKETFNRKTLYKLQLKMLKTLKRICRDLQRREPAHER